MQLSELTDDILGAAIEVHRHLGPGLLESAYETCLVHELFLRGLTAERQVDCKIHYKNTIVEHAFRLDLLVSGQIIVELKSCEHLSAIHEAQLLTYLRLSGHKVGLLINFNTTLLKHGIKRIVL
ncbi:GxxExxY protein [Iodobacter sp. CM08]|uniref:GxxExxY protein n=1 Tax=Iodobacter sp. CM08 TaxID=3085902 RepID=UPI002981B042|nr:GxxExxY protein [Iodobacter sp. CM08]MDW5418856.1 GxxExxY protein [Iodobacter sp. CM08]